MYLSFYKLKETILQAKTSFESSNGYFIDKYTLQIDIKITLGT